MTTAVRSPSPSAVRKKPSFFADEASRKARMTSSVGAVALYPLSTAPSGGSVRARPAARVAMGEDDDAEEEARLQREARLVARRGAGRRLRRRCALLATLTLVVLYCLRRPVPRTTRFSARRPVGAVRKRHSPRPRGVACRSRRAIAWHPAQRERRASRAFLDYLSRRAWRTSPRSRCAGALRRTVLATASAHGTKDAYCARVRRARFFACVATSVALTAKGVAHLPDLDDPPPRTRFSGRRGFGVAPCRRSGG